MSKAPKTRNKGNENQVPNDGIPKETVAFKIVFEIVQKDLADIIVLFQWIDYSDLSGRTNFLTDLAKDWVKTNPSEAKNLSYSKDFAPVIIDENFAKNLCGEKFQVLFISRNDQIVLEKLELNYSSLLFPTSQPKFEYSQSRFTLTGLERFSVRVSADKPLLTTAYREYLNPLQISIEAAKNLPVSKDPSIEYLPAYAMCKFFDDTVLRTQRIDVASKCKWMYKQVVLLGLINPLKLVTLIKTSSLEFEVHDRDEVLKQKEPKKEVVLANLNYEPMEAKNDEIPDKPNPSKKKENITKKLQDQANSESFEKKPLEKPEKKPKADPKKPPKDLKSIEPIFLEDNRKINSNNYGVAHFTLMQFLETDTTSLRLKRNIVPIHKCEEKKEDSDTESPVMKKIRDSNSTESYFDNGSSLIVSFELACAIGPLDPIGNSPVKKTAKKKEDNMIASTNTHTNADQLRSLDDKDTVNASKKHPEDIFKTKIIKYDINNTKFERAVFLFSTESTPLRNQFLRELRAINLKTFGKDPSDVFYLGFKVLSEEEKQDSDLDIITGVEFIDKEYHIFILEGLAEKAMKRLGKNLPICHPDSNDIRIIRNSEFKFENRLYLDFGIDVKKIWFTKNISELICQPEIYLRSKIPESVYQTLKAINEVRRCHNLKAVFAANLFPLVKDIIIIAQMYGDTSMYEDLNGNKSLAFKEIDLKSSSICKVTSEAVPSRNQDLDVSIETSSTDNKSSKSPGITAKQAELLKIGEISANIQKLINKSKFELYNMHCKNPSSKSSSREFFIQGNQSLNYYEGQRKELRKSARMDPNNFYTFSKDYMSAAIDRYDIDEVKKNEVQNSQKRWLTPDGFQNVIKKTLDDYISHPMRPTPEKIVAMLEYPWYVEKSDQEKRLKEVRGTSLKSKSRQDFDLSPRVKGQSSRLDWESVENPYLKVPNKPQISKPSQTARGSPILDPIKGGRKSPGTKINEQESVKPSLKEKEQAPLSIFLNEKWKDKPVQYPVDRHFDRRKSVASQDFDVVIQNPGQLSPVAKSRLKPKAN